MNFMGKAKGAPFEGKTAIIVGGSQGIGKATAAELLRLGGNVCIIARNETVLEEAQNELIQLKITDAQRVDIISADATVESQLVPPLKKYVDKQGCNILVNCVGGVFPKPKYVQDYTIEEFEFTMRVNYMSTIIPIATLLPYFLEKREGHIVNISSMAGYLGLIGYSAYSSAKFAIVGLSEALRHELKPYNIHVSVAYPPDTDTPGLRERESDKIEELQDLSDVAHLLQPDEVAETIVKGIRKMKFQIHIGRSGTINWVKRHLPGLYFWFIDRSLKKSRKKLGKE
jgi:3-dehydrosphinganine reductase